MWRAAGDRFALQRCAPDHRLGLGLVKACDFDPKKGTLTTESKSWAVDPKTGVKKALTSNGEWFDTFEFGSKNGIATQSGDEDDTFAADAPLADAAFGK